MHRHNKREFDGYQHVVYPGTPFAGYHMDLEHNARGTKRGFCVVEFEDDVKSIEFVPIENTLYKLVQINAEAKSAESVNLELRRAIDGFDPAGRVVIINLSGEMTNGKTAET